ncbi:alpha/beta-hydrolase [Saitoella complicata NRRL Y-17804]|uniref:alpha/beta-hydrolase n=1 Tax=Saitoella complicata (strain BCRC 22490 / CBS 7301 / JCM 7358 / NBRC 10748 / NRRL Y-17804) TaxID=698492 RepID=UPI000867F50A|nr:alpha/beta-hydrolase [Saitoella complicata NRRL Y-17804]ODQ55455.1 alpha/beta-hydrolase [Saitoella complicata NRRL Y-17804]
MFPLSFGESFSQWWATSKSAPRSSEHAILATLPFFPGSDGVRKATSSQVKLSGHKQRYVNEFAIEHVNGSESNSSSMVLLHGYGAGLGLFYRNFDDLSKSPDWKLYALDLLGMGNSGRPPFKIRSKDSQAKLDEAEAFFTDALEEWRQERKLEKFTLAAHSLGGYLGVSYALKYPERVEKLILISPVGIPEDPYAMASTPPTVDSDVDAAPPAGDEVDALPARSSSSTNTPKRPYPNWLTFLWERNFSPFMFVRHAGPLGPKVMSAWTHRRFASLPSDQQSLLHTYMYNVFRGRGSGEYALGVLLAPGAYARRPLLHRVSQLKCPTLWMYGSHDWMDANAGREAAAIMQRQGVKAEHVVVPRSGHHIYLDNPEGFNRAVLKFRDGP